MGSVVQTQLTTEGTELHRGNAKHLRRLETLRQQSQLSSLQGEQLFLDRQAAAISGQLAIAADHPMAGNDNGDRVGPVRQSHGARSLRISTAISQLAVGNGFSVGNFAEKLPYFELEGSTHRGERKIEGGEFADKVRLKLAHRIGQRHSVLAPFRIGLHRLPA